jgi:hypothetical protein
MPVTGLGDGIGWIIIVEVLVLAGQKAVIAVMAFCHIDHEAPFFHFLPSLYFSISIKHEFGAMPQAFLEI